MVANFNLSESKIFFFILREKIVLIKSYVKNKIALPVPYVSDAGLELK